MDTKGTATADMHMEIVATAMVIVTVTVVTDTVAMVTEGMAKEGMVGMVMVMATDMVVTTNQEEVNLN